MEQQRVNQAYQLKTLNDIYGVDLGGKDSNGMPPYIHQNHYVNHVQIHMQKVLKTIGLRLKAVVQSYLNPNAIFTHLVFMAIAIVGFCYMATTGRFQDLGNAGMLIEWALMIAVGWTALRAATSSLLPAVIALLIGFGFPLFHLPDNLSEILSAHFLNGIIAYGIFLVAVTTLFSGRER